MEDYKRLRPADEVLPQVQKQPGVAMCQKCMKMVRVRPDMVTGELKKEFFCRVDGCPIG